MLKIKKYIVDVEFTDEDRGHDTEGHWEEVILSNEECEKAIVDYVKENYTVPEDPNREGTAKMIYEDLLSNLDDTEFADQIAEYYGGKYVW